MKITLQNIGKRFNKEWIFRNIDFEFEAAGKYAILGSNGSGKSTLLQIIAGAISQTEGEIRLREELKVKETALNLSPQPSFRDLALAAPYLELPEEMTWREAVKFHGKFKKYIVISNLLMGDSSPVVRNDTQEIEKIISLSGLESSSEKQIRNFSSGMKQRAKLALAILSDTPLLLLDEPCSNLDENAVKWYQNLIAEYAKEKLVIVCSNYNKEEYGFCAKQLVLK